VGKGFLMQVVSDINKLEKDLVVSSGDIITGSINNSWKLMDTHSERSSRGAGGLRKLSGRRRRQFLPQFKRVTS